MKHLIIGGGSIGRRHLTNLRILGEQDLFCLRRGPDTAFEEEYQARILTNEDQVIEVSPDAIYICSPTHLRLESMSLANRIDAHIFVEKPLTHLRQELPKIRSLVPPDRVLFIGFMMRFHPAIVAIKSLLRKNEIGKLFYASLHFGSYLPGWHPYEDYKLGYAANKDMGGGVLNTISHEVDLIRFLFGVPERVFTLNRNFNRLKIDAEESSESIFYYSHMNVSLHLDYLQKQYKRTIEIYGDRGSICWDWNTSNILLNIEGRTLETIHCAVNLNDVYIAELREFINRVVNLKRSGALDLTEAIAATQLVAAMYKSESERVWIERAVWENW